MKITFEISKTNFKGFVTTQIFLEKLEIINKGDSLCI
jgi:hypothetical protein